MAKITNEIIIQYFETYGPIRSKMTKDFDMTRQSLSDRIRKYPELRAAENAAYEKMKDLAVSNVLQLLYEGDWKATEKVIDKMCHDRGFLDKQQIETSGPGGGPVENQINVNFISKKKTEKKKVEKKKASKK
jgi:hypothetical protein